MSILGKSRRGRHHPDSFLVLLSTAIFMCEAVVRSHNSSCRSSPTEATCKKTPDELGTFEYSRYNLKVKSEHPPDKGHVFDVNGAIAAQLLTTCECCCQWWRWATQLFTMSPQKLFARRDIVDRIIVPVIDDEASFCDESCRSQPRCLFFFSKGNICVFRYQEAYCCRRWIDD